jgi:predicted dinucleotide-binding enzyme
MTTIGFIGSGNIGGTVARLAAAAGYDVVLSNSRGPQTLADAVAEIGPKARAATAHEAAAAGDLVVFSVPLKAVPATPGDALAGKVVLDTGNYYPERDGRIAELENGSTGQSEWTATHLPGARVVKVFNNIFFKHLGALARPAGAADRSALAVAGDDAEAKKAAIEFLDAIGYDAVDAGSLADGRKYEPGTEAYGKPYGTFDNEAGTPADAATVRTALGD